MVKEMLNIYTTQMRLTSGSEPSQENSDEIGKVEVTETELAHSEEIFRLLVGAVSDYAIFALDPNGIILTWNTGAIRLKGYDASEVVGTSFTRFYTPPDVMRKHPEWELEQATKNGTYEEEGFRLRKDGTLFWANVVITALRDKNGKLRGFGKVTRDLTARRQSEEALRQSEERFRLMIEGVTDYAIFMLDPEGKIATWNAGAERNKGYKTSEIIGKHFSIFYPQADLDADKPGLELREATRVGKFEDTGFRVRKDGTRFWANVVITAIRDKSGKLIGFSKVTRDLTERKAAEEKIERAYKDLEQRVRDRTADLEKAKLEAEKAVASRDEFFSIASHELRTPITSLKLKSQIAKRRIKTARMNSVEQMEAYIDETEVQLERLVKLIEDMLDLTRVSTGRLPMEFEIESVSDATREAVSRLEPQFNEQGTPIEFKGSSDALARIDRTRLQQVVTNLLTNTLRYAPGKPVSVEVTRNGDKIILAVKDNGPGISKENQQTIFNRYERLAPTDNISGLGIGLYLARSIVTEHGGTISVVSESGSGALFQVELPVEKKSNVAQLKSTRHD